MSRGVAQKKQTNKFDPQKKQNSLGHQREGFHADGGTRHGADGDAAQRRRVVNPHHRLKGAAQRVDVALLAVLLACARTHTSVEGKRGEANR